MVPPKKKRRVVQKAADTSAAANTVDVAVATTAKTTSSSMDVDDDANSAPTAAQNEHIARKDALTKELIEELDGLESSEGGSSEASSGHANISITLLKLKSLQRGLLEKVRETQETLRKQALVRDRQGLQLDNLRYQRTILERSQLRSDAASEKASVEIAKLIRNCDNGNGNGNNNNNNNGNGNDNNNKEGKRTIAIGNDEKLLQNFLGANWEDPSQRPAIVSKLNQEVATRKDLEKKKSDLMEDRKSKQDALAARQKLLKDLPTKLAEMERASLPLQKFFQKQSNNATTTTSGGNSNINSSNLSLVKVTPKLGTTKRRNRLDLAKTLPSALYVLFHQLQSCLDVLEMPTKNATSRDSRTPTSGEVLPTIEIETTAAAAKENYGTAASPSTNEEYLATAAVVVVLKIPIPTVSAGGGLTYKHKKQQASISFEYDSTSDLVLASCSADYDMGQVVIDELFPGDKGEYLLPATHTATNATAVAFSRSSDRGSARAYQWCNYLAGLHVAPAEQTAAKMHCSARVILRALSRRVRATATLSWILHGLSQKQQQQPRSVRDFPVHAALKHDDDDDDDNANDQEPKIKLSSWTALEDTSNKHNIRVYKAVLQRGNTANENSSAKTTSAATTTATTLTGRVCINLARYPSVIPRWKFISSPPLSSSLYENNNKKENDNEASLETLPLYNEGLARLERDVNRDAVDRLVVPSDQSTYDWILGQQLVEIARVWGDSFKDRE